MSLFKFLKRTDEKTPKVLVLGSGALSIGQAGEFDYSGAQALKALEEEGIQTILVNPNIATIQTDTTANRKTYLYPVKPLWVEKIIKEERPDAILAGFGGQTGLNCVLALDEQGILEKYNVKNLGTCIESLRLTEDRDLFANVMRSIDIPIPPSMAVKTLEDAKKAALKIGYPLIIRAAYALGGLGSGFAHNDEDLSKIVKTALNFSPQVLLEKSLEGWEEIEYEVMRDIEGNVITICNMENIDPLGVHTGDSIVVAPSQTLTDNEFQTLRNASIKIVNKLNIVGECNVQFALDPISNSFYVIEVNARLSRSSALASKATGYPIAYIAAKLVAGYNLIELNNPVTGKTRAFFEPAMDYVVIKIPRWDLRKFSGASRKLGSSMKSVGEVMAIGRNFAEAIQKAVRMASENPNGMSVTTRFKNSTDEELISEVTYPTDERLLALVECFRRKMDIERIHSVCRVDKWFLKKIDEIVVVEDEIISTFNGLVKKVTISDDRELYNILEDMLFLVSKDTWIHWKKTGFSDQQILTLALNNVPELVTLKAKYDDEKYFKKLFFLVRKIRKNNVRPVVKKIDTTAAEYPTPSNYLYVTYEGTSSDTKPFDEGKTPIIILGSGAYRIGSSVEFDWCGVKCTEYIKNNNMQSIVINCNPETVSTDYSTSDKLYFEEISTERVLDIYEFENPKGLINSMGGQLPNVLTDSMAMGGIKLLGHSVDTIDMAENREKFSALLDKIGIDQPRWKNVKSKDELNSFIEEVGFPILVRPSFVLSGTAMKVANTKEALEEYMEHATKVSPDHPVVISEFLQDYREIELDGVAHNGKILISFMTEHLENAGIHSGDATLIYPPQKLYVETVRRVKQAGTLISKELNLNGPFNIQFLAASNKIKVIECNARASRSFPFISKVTGINLADLASRVFVAGLTGEERIIPPSFDEYNLASVGVKAPMFSFSRLEGADPILGVEMSSTGEVGCLGNSFDEALLLSLEATGVTIPKKGVLISSGRLHEKIKMLDAVTILEKLDIPIYATEGTAKFLEEHGHKVKMIGWPEELDRPNVITAIRERWVDFVINVPKNLEKEEMQHGADIRKNAIKHGTSLITTAEMATAFFRALQQYDEFINDHKPVMLPQQKHT
ncbi:MAG: carbamoyl-phosphate synthase (glutamine-hydrolyzing) large subunit [bacterium]